MPLRYSKGQKLFLDRQFAAANRLYNRLAEAGKDRLDELMQSESWQMLMSLREQFSSLAEEIGIQPT